jgi:hypothetical protein
MGVYTIGERYYTFDYGFARSTGSSSLNNHNENAPVVDGGYCCPMGVPIGKGRPYSGNGNVRTKIPTVTSINIATVGFILQTEMDSLCGCDSSSTKMVGVCCSLCV